MPGSRLSKGDIFDDSFFQALKEADQELKAILTTFNKLAKEAIKVSNAIKEAKSFEALSKAAKKAADETRKLTAEEKKLQRAQETLNLAQSDAGKKLAVLTEQKRRAAAENRKYAKSQLEAVKSTNRWGTALGSFQFKFNALGNLIAQAAATVFRSFIRAVRQSVEVVKQFDKSSARLASVIGKTRKEIEGLTKQAKQLGSITQFTATQVTGLQIELAKLGFEAEEIAAATPGILSFATATGADLAAAAKTAGAAVRVFGLNASETEDAVATLAVATTKSGLTFEHYDTILSTVGPVAKAYGFTLEDVVALTGELASKGFEANKAATATRNILLNLADANGALAKKLGGAATTFEGLIDGLIEADKQGISLGETLELTDKRSVAAFSTFLEGAESARTLRDGITDVNKELQAMVDIQLDTLAGDIDLLKSAWEGFILGLSSDGGILRSAVQLLTNAVLQAQNLDLAVKKFHKQNAEQLTRSVDLLESLTNKQGTEFSKLTEVYADATSFQLMQSREAIIFHLGEIRKINAKEAVALYEEILRQRKEQEDEEIQALIEKNNRLQNEEEKAARKKKIVYADVSEELKKLKKEETEALIEDDQEYSDAYFNAWDEIEKNAEGAFEYLEELEKQKHDDYMRNLQEEREAEDKALKERIEAEEFLKDLQIDSANQSFNFVAAILDRKAAKIDEQLKNEVISEEEAEEQKAKLRRKAALVDKAQALFNIALNTAIGVTSALAKTVTIPLIPWIIGLGALQAATVLAAPVPAFEKGTESAPGGWAVAGEKGHELMVGPDGKIGLTPDSATLMDIEKGTKVFPADVTTQLMKYSAIATGLGGRVKDDSLIIAMMGRIDDSSERLRRELKNKPVSSSIITPAGILTSTHKGNTVIKKMNKFFG